MVKEKHKALSDTVEWLREESRIKTSFTLASKKMLCKRDVVRMVGKFLNSEGIERCLVVVASDAKRCNAWHIGLGVSVDRDSLKRWFDEINKKLKLGYSKLFFSFGVVDPDRYMVEHDFYEEKMFC